MSLILSPGGRRYGGRPSSFDPRDFDLLKLAAPAVLPSVVDLSSFCGAIKNQGDMGACTAFSSTSMLEFNFKKYKNVSVTLSPLFQYYNERIMDGDFPQDAGSTGRTAVTCLNKFGVCLEKEEPFNPSAIAQVPTSEQIQEALAYRSGAYHAITNLEDMKKCLASGYGFIVGFTVYSSFESDAMASSGLMSVPDESSEQVLGGHEVFFCGYDDTVKCPGASAPGAFKVQNSWGTDWGQKGWFYFPYQCVNDPNIFDDAFISHFGIWK